MKIDLSSVRDEYDIVVVGAGAAGLSAALFAALKGAHVLLVESTEVVGGTTAFSGGTAWVPCSHHDEDPDPAAAKLFLEDVIGESARPPLIDGFLESGPKAIRLLEDRSEVKFVPYAKHPDYEQNARGATLRGRALMPVPFDGGQLGSSLSLVRKPIPEMTIFGGLMVDANDIQHFMSAFKNPGSFAHTLRRLTKHFTDLAIRKRSSHMTNGNALVGRFLASLQAHKTAHLVTQTRSLALDKSDDDRKWTLTLSDEKTERRVTARRGVIMAAGGFTRSAKMRAALLPQVEIHSPTAPGATGEMQDLAQAAGAAFGPTDAENGFWAPVSIRKRADGSTASYPHFLLDRSKPRSLCVDQTGKRFVNESTSYHKFARAMLEHGPAALPTYFIMDAPGIRKYGLGIVKPGTRSLAPFVADGYLTEAASVEELAAKIGVDAANLRASVDRMNQFAKTGVDTDFGKGTTDYHRHNGDPTVGPNPSLGPIEQGPFYAVRLYPGDIGSANGIVTDEWARALDANGQPLEGLYAVGNEAKSMMEGTYPSPGITIGPAIAFAYRAIEKALGEAKGH